MIINHMMVCFHYLRSIENIWPNWKKNKCGPVKMAEHTCELGNWQTARDIWDSRCFVRHVEEKTHTLANYDFKKCLYRKRNIYHATSFLKIDLQNWFSLVGLMIKWERERVKWIMIYLPLMQKLLLTKLEYVLRCYRCG